MSAALAAMAVNRPARVTWVCVVVAVKVVAEGSAAMVAQAGTAKTHRVVRLQDLVEVWVGPEVLAV